MTTVRLLPDTTAAAAAGRLTAWTNAWLAGRVGADDALAAVTDGGPQTVLGLGDDPEPLAALLIGWRRQRVTRCTLALPVPGDVRGVHGSPAARAAALDCGAMVITADEVVVPRAGQWHRFVSPPPPTAGPTPASDVRASEVDLAQAARETTETLRRLGPIPWAGESAGGLASARAAGSQLRLPSGHPGPAVRLLAQAERLAAVVALAEGGDCSLSGAAVASRDAALRSLATAVRRAMVSAYNARPEADGT